MHKLIPAWFVCLLFSLAGQARSDEGPRALIERAIQAVSIHQPN